MSCFFESQCNLETSSIYFSLLVVLAIRSEIDMIETGKLDQRNNPLKVSDK